MRKAHTLLGGILQRAVDARRIPTNPQRLMSKPAAAPKREAPPLAPVTVEAVRDRLLAGAGRRHARGQRAEFLRRRDAIFVSLLAYGGARPQEVRGLPWGRIHEATMVI
jgi:integrase